MSLQDKLRERAAPFLPGEMVRHTVMAEAGAPPWLFFGVVLGLGAFVVLWLMRPLIIAVTDGSLVVLRSGRFRPSFPKEVVARLPRQTRLGPAKGLLWARVEVAGQRVWIHRRFFDEVAAADAPLLAPPPATATPPAGALFPIPEAGAAGWGMPEAGTPLAGGTSVASQPGAWTGTPLADGTSAASGPGAWPLRTGRGRPWQWVLAGTAGIFTVLIFVGTVAQNNESAANDRLAAYVAGSAKHSFVAADGRFRAEFPGIPQRQTQRQKVADIELETIVYERSLGQDTSFLVTYVDVPAVPADVIGALNGAANAVAIGLKGEILRSEQSVFAGRPAIEFVLNTRVEGGTKGVHYGKITLVLDDRRLYSIGVIGPVDPPDGYDRFMASFSILP